MEYAREHAKPRLGFKHHAKVHTFRLGTALLTWALLGAALFYRPEWIR